MSVISDRPLVVAGSELRRRRWQQNSGRQQSFSLDFPQNLYDSDSLSRGLDSSFCTNPVRARDEDRYFLYLPRNLSYCEVCADVIRDHVQKKVRLLSSRLCQLEDVPPTPIDSESSIDFDDDENGGLWTTSHLIETDTQKNMRRSILKRKKRAISFPPPRREGKKIVRFADSLGLELESVRYHVQSELTSCLPLPSFKNGKSTCGELKKIQLVPAFLSPSLSKEFMKRLRSQKVCLHSVSTADSTIYGIVSVINLTFHKSVFIRYTANAWMSYHDENASYLEGSSESDTDKFSFTLFCNPCDLSATGHSLFFAVGFQTQDNEMFWDNNNGKNYCIKCEMKEVPIVGSHSWVHFL